MPAQTKKQPKPITAPVVEHCQHCRLEKPTAKNWTRFGGKPVCDCCKKERYVTRALTLPICGAAKAGEPFSNDGWYHFAAEFRDTYDAARYAYDWVAQELYRRDELYSRPFGIVKRLPELDVRGLTEQFLRQCKKVPLSDEQIEDVNKEVLELYKKKFGIASSCPMLPFFTGANGLVKTFQRHVGGVKLPGSTFDAIRNAALATYQRVRKLNYSGQAKKPAQEYKDEVVIPIRIAQYELAKREGCSFLPGVAANRVDSFVLQVNVLPGNHPRWDLLFPSESNPDYRRQIGTLRKIMCGEYERCDSGFLMKKHRDGPAKFFRWTRGGTECKDYNILCKIVYRMPKHDRPPDSTNVLLLRHRPDCFVEATVIGDTVHRTWKYNGDQIHDSAQEMKRKIERHAQWRQRLNEDKKASKRMCKRWRRRLDKATESPCEAHNRRLTNFRKMIAAEIAKYAQRNHCAVVLYDNHDYGYFPSFPMYLFHSDLKTALCGNPTNQRGIDILPDAGNKEEEKLIHDILEEPEQVEACEAMLGPLVDQLFAKTKAKVKAKGKKPDHETLVAELSVELRKLLSLATWEGRRWETDEARRMSLCRSMIKALGFVSRQRQKSGLTPCVEAASATPATSATSPATRC